MKNYKCQNCGAQLQKRTDGTYFCEYCRHVYDSETAEQAYQIACKQITAAAKSAVSQAILEQKLEQIAKSRYNLYVARNREFISNAELKTWANEIRKYNPYDVQANFFMLAADKRWAELNRYLTKINAKDHIHLLKDFVVYLTSGQFIEKCILAINDMIASSISETSPTYKAIHAIIAKAAKTANSGVFDETLPRDVFVAYSSKDKQKAYELVEYLEEKGVKCFISMRNLPKGVDAELLYNERLQRAMDNCQVFLFVSSKNSRSKLCDAYSLEMQYIKEQDIKQSGNANYYRNNYQQLVENCRSQCKPRVQYLIENYGDTLYEDQVKIFFSGLSWCTDKESVYSALKKILSATPNVAPQAQPVKKIETKASERIQAFKDEQVANISSKVDKIVQNAFDRVNRKLDEKLKKQETQADLNSDFEIQNGVLVNYYGKGGKVVIPSGVTSIGKSAFYQCKSLMNVVIPNSVTSIGDCAFQHCSGLKTVVIPNSVTSIGSNAFSWCKSLTSVIIADSVTSIGELAFSFCGNVTIYCEVTSKPSGWSFDWNWNNHHRPVVWGVTREQFNNMQ